VGLRTRLGLRPQIVPHTGYGTTTLARLSARVRLARTILPAPADAGAVATARAHFRRWVTMELAGMSVDVEVEGHRVLEATDGQGFLQTALSVDLAPGWHEVHFHLDDPRGAAEATGRLVVPDPDIDLAVVTDVDDTIIHTGLTRGWEMVRQSMLRVEERTALPGAAELYQRLVVGPPGRPERPLFYLSTSPWNLYDVLADFIALHDFPPGPLFLTDWDWRGLKLFRPPSKSHKTAALGRLVSDFPHVGLLLIGDSGQEDPEIYAAFAHAAPDRVRAIYIRDAALPGTGQLLPGRADEVRNLAAELADVGVPMLLIQDSAELADHARSLGLLHA
jgi:phosphatidate phosphatase APP1